MSIQIITRRFFRPPNQITNAIFFQGYHIGQHCFQSGEVCNFDQNIKAFFIIRGRNVPVGINTDIVTTPTNLAVSISTPISQQSRNDFDGAAIPEFAKRFQKTKITRHEHIDGRILGFRTGWRQVREKDLLEYVSVRGFLGDWEKVFIIFPLVQFLGAVMNMNFYDGNVCMYVTQLLFFNLFHPVFFLKHMYIQLAIINLFPTPKTQTNTTISIIFTPQPV